MRRGLRFVPLALLLAVLVEVVVFVLLGQAVGFGWAVLVVFVASVTGLLLLRREGVRAWRAFRDAARAGRPPGPQVTDGLVGLAAGLLLATPGLVSALAGALLVVPPVRRLARVGAQRAAERRVSSMVAGDLFGPRRVRVYPGAAQRPPAADAPVVSPEPVVADPGAAIEGEIVEPRRR